MLIAFLSIAALSAIWGIALGSVLPLTRLPWLMAVPILLLALFLAFLIGHWATQKMDAVERERMSWRKGATGEWLTAGVLKSLPDGYAVINDVTKKLGNVDHVVIGPTGIYVINAKNWKGTVKADGKGELLVNGRSPKETISFAGFLSFRLRMLKLSLVQRDTSTVCVMIASSSTLKTKRLRRVSAAMTSIGSLQRRCN